MAANSTQFDPMEQTFTLLGPDGATPIPVSVPEVDYIYYQALASEVNYGSQIGACFIMLLVLLTMTPKNRFTRWPTIINIAGLSLGLIRCLLLSLFFTSSWMEFYTVTSGDVSQVQQQDYNISVTATAFSIPIVILIESALAIQAWAMLQLWPALYKFSATFISAGVVLVTIGFDFASVILQCRGIVYGIDLTPLLWVRQTDLAMTTASISWFCFLFIVRLAMHMWKHRSILPSVKGLSAMEVLVMTNGILMLIPIIFAGLEFGAFNNFESGSLTQTSVLIVLPLGTLVAQRLANPTTMSIPSRDGASTTGVGSKQPFLRSWHSTATSDTQRHGVTTRVVSEHTHEKANAVDMELARIDDGDLEHGVRVNRRIEHQERRISDRL